MRRFALYAGLLAALLSPPSALHAQTSSAPAVEDPPPFLTIYDAEFLRSLPTAESLFAVLDALQPSVVADRGLAAGLYAGQPARIGGFLSSWTQTTMHVDGVSITDPTGSGAPLLFPDLAIWQHIRVRTGLFRAGEGGSGLSIDLDPIGPTERWSRSVDASASHGVLAAGEPAAGAPAIARLDGWDRAAIVARGPLLKDRLGATFALSASSASQFYRGEPFSVDASAQSAFSHLVFTLDADDAIRIVGWVQHHEYPLDQRAVLRQPLAVTTEAAGHAQAVWEHKGVTPWRASASYSGRGRTPNYGGAVNGITDRLVDGPVTQFASLGAGSVGAWTLAAHLSPTRAIGARTHAGEIGADAEGGHSQSSSFFSGTIGELVHESPGRIWRFTAPDVPSSRHAVTFGAYASDTVTLAERLRIDAGIRFESATGAAAGAANGIGWRSLLPRAAAHWTRDDRWHLAAFAGYAESGRRLALDDLAIGDPGAPTADVYRWNALPGLPLSLSDRGALVARVGPGTGGTAAFTSIDPDLKRPTTDEVIVGVDARPRSGLFVRVTGVTRTEHHLLGLTNIGAPASSAYSTFTVRDAGSDPLDPSDDATLVVYNRLPASFGRDRYVLTTPGHQGSTFKGIEGSLRFENGRLAVTGGVTAGVADTFAANVGAGPLENDQTLAGELFATGNASTLARGRPFTDRAYTAKFAGVYRFPREVRLGLVARAQGGQPFARVLVFPGLNQGADAVRAFPNGASRLARTGTLDARLQKPFTLAGHRIDGMLDAYNILNRSSAVEEDVAAPPDVRMPTAVQPPRAIHIGVRLEF